MGAVVGNARNLWAREPIYNCRSAPHARPGKPIAAPIVVRRYRRPSFFQSRARCAPTGLRYIVKRMFSSARRVLCASRYFSRLGATKETVTDW